MDIAFTSGFSCSPILRVTNHSSDKNLKTLTTNPAKRSLGRYYCSSYSSAGNHIQLKKGSRQYFENVKVKRTRAYYKSEEYDITEASVDSFKSSEGSSEAVLIGGNLQETSPWWEQFPKRWVIVLLCFSAFLLCNMDRVSSFLFAYFSCHSGINCEFHSFTCLAIHFTNVVLIRRLRFRNFPCK